MRNSTWSWPALGTTFRAVLAAACLAANVPAAIAAGESWRDEFDQAVEIAVAGDLKGGLTVLSRLEDQHPDELEIIRVTAQLLARTGRNAEAIKRFHRLKETSPDNLTDREAILFLLLSDGDAEGLYLAEEVKPHSGTGTGDADPVWAADLDPTTPPVMHINRTDWQPGGMRPTSVPEST